MRFLHTSDLHLGKRLNDINLLEDQKETLRRIVKKAEDHMCDAVLIAGDIYDKTNPSAEAMNAFDSFLQDFTERNIPVFIISGNHDSQQRVAYMSGIARRSGVYICGGFDGRLSTYALEDEYGKLYVHLLPFIKPADVRKFYPDKQIETYDDAVRIVIENSEIDPGVRNVIVAHQFVTGAEICDSEIFAIGGLDNISAGNFDIFDYAAMGHIHGPQYVSRPEVRYSGSPLKYSFSETNHRKSVTIAELREKGCVEISTSELGFIHDVREVRGKLDELMEQPYSEDYVRVTLIDENVPPDARVSLQTVYPNMMRFAVENSKTGEVFDNDGGADVESRTPLELFSDFYRLMNNDVPPSEEHIALIEKILERLGETQI